MMTAREVDDLRRRAALLEATLREFVRLAVATEGPCACVPLSAALDAEHAAEWRTALRRARSLVGSP